MEKHEIEALIREIEDETAELGVYPAPVPALNPDTMAKYIDHTYLKPEATVDDIRRICAEAREMGTASVCVNPSYIRLVAEELRGTDVTPCCVIGFPLGATTPDVKAFEAEGAVMDGAREVDMVINVGAAKSGDWKLVRRDIEAVVDAVAGEAQVKVIIETCLLTEKEKLEMCRVVSDSGADYIKTSTGFSSGGATFDDIRLIKANIEPHLRIKAAGGISTLGDAETFLEMGADRLGTSRLVKLAKEAEAK